MPVNSVLAPYPTFFDATGAPLESGYIYIGTAGFEARSTPKASFFDVALTIPTGTASGAAIRTKGGFPINNSNAPAMFYVDGDFSISVCDRNGVLLYSALSMTLALNVGGAVGPVLGSDGNLGAVGIGFVNEPNTGFVRSGANIMQTAVGGVLVATQTPTGVVFAQPVSGSGFNTGVLAIAQPVDADLTALAGLSGTGIAVRTAGSTWAQRQVVSTDGTVTITNPAGVAGNIDLSARSTGTVTTQTLTGAGPFDFTVPSTVNEIQILFSGVSLSGVENLLVQIGDSGGVETSGYVSTGNTTDSTSGFIIAIALAARAVTGVMTLIREETSEKWIETHSVALIGERSSGGGSKTLSGAITTIRILSSGSNTFDNSGTVSIRYWS